MSGVGRPLALGLVARAGGGRKRQLRRGLNRVGQNSSRAAVVAPTRPVTRGYPDVAARSPVPPYTATGKPRQHVTITSRHSAPKAGETSGPDAPYFRRRSGQRASGLPCETPAPRAGRWASRFFLQGARAGKWLLFHVST